jgi:hypothetical protein
MYNRFSKIKNMLDLENIKIDFGLTIQVKL